MCIDQGRKLRIWTGRRIAMVDFGCYRHVVVLLFDDDAYYGSVA